MLVLGHGLAGTCPDLRATLHVLSAWANNLKGCLPELYLNGRSTILVHSNYFSCKLPKHGSQQPTFSMALIGNRFTQPSSGFPPWIYALERSQLFCVSNEKVEHHA
eukprot:3391471-Amphidinium_carterae.3